MPIYEYRCSQCDTVFEEFVRSVTRLREVVCPECGGVQAERSLSVFSTSGNSSSTGATSSASVSAGSACRPSG